MQRDSIRSALRASGFSRLRHGAGALALCLSSALASAGVTYTVTDLPDTTPGQDLWRYHYSISGPLTASNAINVLFSPPASYSNLLVTGSTSGISPLVAQPDPALPADGMLTVTALNTLLATDVETVDLDFVWLGGPTAAPGSQAYEVLDDSFNTVSSGQTQLAGTQPGPQPVPEPGPLALITAALLALPALRRKKLNLGIRSK